MSARRPTKTKRMRRAAVERARIVGVPPEVEPASRRFDGSPVLGRGQAFVTPTGETFHRTWCETIGQLWDQHPDSLRVVAEDTVGPRRPCKNCEVV